ncbi:MAG: chemotaxis protein CheB [Lachnospiraceae bacterium]|nr:chemotaxis protein CheB [Lachnospiraceae bacterium]
MEKNTKKILRNGNYAPMSSGKCDIIREVKAGSKVVAIASSTGGPHALHSVIPALPQNLNAPVLLVQHMPKGFTHSLAERLNELSRIQVKEATDGEELRKGTVYIAKGGVHMKVHHSTTGRYYIRYSDEPVRDGVKPNANYMYESLADSGFESVVCAVLTGMGADGTDGISALRETDNTYVIAQNEESCTVFGMPGSIVKSGLADIVLPLNQIAQEIVRKVGVQ